MSLLDNWQWDPENLILWILGLTKVAEERANRPHCLQAARFWGEAGTNKERFRLVVIALHVVTEV